MALTDAPSPCEINLDDASAAWKELHDGSAVRDFAWAIFTFPENLFAKHLEVHRQEKGGVTEMCQKIQELTKNSTACWGGFKIHAVNKANSKEHTVKFVGFEFIPPGCKINAKRVAKEVRPHVQELLGGTDIFLDATSIDQLSDTPANCQVLAELLKLPEDQALQCHAVADVESITAAFEEVLQSADDEFAYILAVPHTGVERTFDLVKSTEGGVTEMIKEIQKLTGGVLPVFGAYKVLSVDTTSGARTSKFIKFLFASSEAQDTYNRAITEMRPYILGAIEKVDLTLEVNSVEDLRDAAVLATKLGLSEDFQVQLHSVRNVAEASEVIQAVLNSERDDFSYVVITRDGGRTRDLDIRKSTEGGLNEMMEIVHAIAAEKRPSYGLFKVQSVDDKSFSRKKPINTKYIGFLHLPDGDATLVTEIAPHISSIFDKDSLDMYIETSDVQDVSDTLAIAVHLRLKDEYTFYEFGDTVSVRTSIMLNVDKAGKEFVEIAHTMDAWGRVLSNIRSESFAIFALTPDRKVLEVVVDGAGPGLKSCQLATNMLMARRKPAWGVFRVQGQNEKNNKAASRSKYVGFQVIPPDTPPLVRSTVRLMKPLLKETLKQATYWIEAESADCFSEEVVTKKLTEMSGAENATKFDYGGYLTPEGEAWIKETVEKLMQTTHEQPIGELEGKQAEMMAEEVEHVTPA
eukprot:GEMP01004759.1.p1 GENE.GEMP01004759.1~~GEMP01004759.1.p1  ORF type:complete len:690 (+),score=177.79 GEMP01004759.1:161-2230(+)